MRKLTLDFIFTETGFYPDVHSGEDNSLAKEWLRDSGIPALFDLGTRTDVKPVTPTAAFLRQVARAFFRALTDLPELELAREKAQPQLDEMSAQRLLDTVPFALGTEHISKGWLDRVFEALQGIYASEISGYDGSVKMYLAEKSQDLHVPERIFFHLVENREDPGFPFAFLATYATADPETGRIRHMPLRYALTEFQGKREKLVELLSCLNQAAEVCPLLGSLMQKGELFHPLKLTGEEAYEFLCAIEDIERLGILCRIPNWWRSHAATITKTLRLGEEKPSMLGFDSLVQLQPQLMVDGIPLTEQDIRRLLEETEGLAFLKGKWIEVDHGKLQDLLNSMQNDSSITLLEALRMGTIDPALSEEDLDGDVPITNGQWLNEFLQTLRDPGKIRKVKPPATLKATLRPYQETGFNWLRYMDRLRFGACLADDMGLGKTIQVLTYLEKMRQTERSARCLLIVPASLVDNWRREAEKFTPNMPVYILHGRPSAVLAQELQGTAAFLTITTYGMAARIDQLKEIEWDCLILDEAQAIKNPGTKQTWNIKRIPAHMRIALTGTPIENDLSNLWSIFDFLNKGLLGTSGQFRAFTKKLEEDPGQYARLKSMISPFLLRRMKTDKSIISDLPEKMETIDHTELSAKQIVLYRKVVADMEYRIQNAEGMMDRRGLVLAAIMKLKQICNHPDQYLGQPTFAPGQSGKFAMLREICETIYAKRERVLVFTQFREMCDPLASFLNTIFHGDGFVLHGGTPVKERGKIVEAFQAEAYVPFMVLSVKAGGTGLNLTKASHVIHFDRWWNPAVENQATDRAFRIGQKKNVMVHKLVSTGTIEEKIDAIIESKKDLAENVIGSGGENWITEMNDEQLHELFRLEV